MNPVQPPDFLGPITAVFYALMPYIGLAGIVGTSCKTGLHVMGQTFEGRRSKRHAVLGMTLTVLNVGLAWVTYVAFLTRSTGFVGQSPVNAITRSLEGTPDVIMALAQLSPWTLIAVAFGMFLGFILVVGRPSRRQQSGRRAAPARRVTYGRRALRNVKAELTGQMGEAAVVHVIAATGYMALHDVVLEDSRGLTQVDHLVLTPDAIVVIETKTYSGFISGDPASQQWVQHLLAGSVRSPFQNPLRQNYRHRSAVMEILADLQVEVRGFVVSAGSARFCDALVGAVVPLDHLAETLASCAAFAKPALLVAAWGRLVVAAERGEARRGDHLLAVQNRKGQTA